MIDKGWDKLPTKKACVKYAIRNALVVAGCFVATIFGGPLAFMLVLLPGLLATFLLGLYWEVYWLLRDNPNAAREMGLD